MADIFFQGPASLSWRTLDYSLDVYSSSLRIFFFVRFEKVDMSESVEPTSFLCGSLQAEENVNWF